MLFVENSVLEKILCKRSCITRAKYTLSSSGERGGGVGGVGKKEEEERLGLVDKKGIFVALGKEEEV